MGRPGTGDEPTRSTAPSSAAHARTGRLPAAPTCSTCTARAATARADHSPPRRHALLLAHWPGPDRAARPAVVRDDVLSTLRPPGARPLEVALMVSGLRQHARRRMAVSVGGSVGAMGGRRCASRRLRSGHAYLMRAHRLVQRWWSCVHEQLLGGWTVAAAVAKVQA